MLSYTELALEVSDADDYASERAWSDWTGTDETKSAALRRGQDFLAAKYNSRWLVEWENDEAPEEVVYAIIECGRRELVSPGSLSPDLARGGRIKSVGAGSARVEYMDGAPGGTLTPKINDLLSSHISRASGSIPLLRV